MLRFDITDANDNNPYFTKCPRDPIRLPEDTGVGNKLIMVVRAKDNDRINGDNPSPFGEIRYQIQGTRFYSFTDTEIARRIILAKFSFTFTADEHHMLSYSFYYKMQCLDIFTIRKYLIIVF